MGYLRKKKTYSITIDDPEYKGLSVTMSGLPVRDMLRLQSYNLSDEGDVGEALEFLAGHIVSWNMEELSEDGARRVPVPVTVEALLDMDLDFVIKLIDAWTDEVTGVSDPLDQPSSAGERFPAVSVKTETLSPSPESLSMLSGSSTTAAPSTFSPAPS